MLRQNSTPTPSLVLQFAITLALLVMSVGTGVCHEYLDRSDTITSGVADATETNKAVQTITRWPRASRQDRWVSDGERARTAIVRYKTGKAIPPRTLSNKTGTATEMPVAADTPVEAGPSQK
jgi:hypothetical protein